MKTTIGVISRKATLHVQHTFLYIFCRCFARLQSETFRNFFVTRFFGGNFVRVLVPFFSLQLIFTLHWCSVAFLILSPPLQNFLVVLPTKKYLLFCFLSLALDLCPTSSPGFFLPHPFFKGKALGTRLTSVAFFSLIFTCLPPTFSFSLSFSCSILQICGHDN